MAHTAFARAANLFFIEIDLRRTTIGAEQLLSRPLITFCWAWLTTQSTEMESILASCARLITTCSFRTIGRFRGSSLSTWDCVTSWIFQRMKLTVRYRHSTRHSINRGCKSTAQVTQSAHRSAGSSRQEM